MFQAHDKGGTVVYRNLTIVQVCEDGTPMYGWSLGFIDPADIKPGVFTIEPQI